MTKSSPRLSRFAIALAALGALAAIVYLVWGGGGGGGGGEAAAANPDDPAQVAQGRAVYAEHCAACHGARLEGQPNWRSRLPGGGLPAPPHDETGHTWHHPDQQLFEITKYGGARYAPPSFQSNMPGFGEAASDAELWAALAYIMRSWPEKIRIRQNGIDRRARAVQ